jgi:integrase/recombinase XerD
VFFILGRENTMVSPLRVRLSGPLKEFGPGFVGELERLGYSPVGATLQVRLMARVSSWMQANDVACRELSGEVLERFLAARRAAGHRDYVSARAVAPLLAYLRGLGLVPSASPVQPSTRAGVLGERFRGYLIDERGLAKGTVTGYVDAVKLFLAGLDEDGLDLGELTAGRVTAFVVARCPGQSRGAAKMTVCALRSLLGFMHVEGLIAESLTGAVPSAASWGLSGLPRFLEPGQAQALLDSCDQQTATGRRDLAILTLCCGSGCALARSRACHSTTLIGVLGNWLCSARAAAASGSRCPLTSGKQSAAICVTVGLTVLWSGRSSFAPRLLCGG